MEEFIKYIFIIIAIIILIFVIVLVLLAPSFSLESSGFPNYGSLGDFAGGTKTTPLSGYASNVLDNINDSLLKLTNPMPYFKITFGYADNESCSNCQNSGFYLLEYNGVTGSFDEIDKKGAFRKNGYEMARVSYDINKGEKIPFGVSDYNLYLWYELFNVGQYTVVIENRNDKSKTYYYTLKGLEGFQGCPQGTNGYYNSCHNQTEFLNAYCKNCPK